ncbi:SRPBCC family protein [Changchengzhania lutea]|uniref:SRPBCC family protein n=1 Tax=Changchengzhania lutea TaxID=2049305 RepID=UPI00115F4CCE|nr:SRPBCC domain-containing protein [Changchengzhania lutea]
MNYQNNQLIKSSQEKAFNAVLSHIPLWWGKIDNINLQKVGDQFSIFFEENTVWKFEITKISPNKEIRWKCIEAYHIITGLDDIETEWLNTELIWKFSESDTKNQILLSFEHKGLSPQLNCYEACNNGWNYFVGSLKLLLETGKGTPNIVE